MADTPSAPPLPDGSVDFNAIHSAARQGHDLDKAVGDARHVPEGEKAGPKPRTTRKTKPKKPAPNAEAQTKPTSEPVTPAQVSDTNTKAGPATNEES